MSLSDRSKAVPLSRSGRLTIVAFALIFALYLGACSTYFLVSQNYKTTGSFNSINLNNSIVQHPSTGESSFDLQSGVSQVVLAYRIFPASTAAQMQISISGPSSDQVAASVVVTAEGTVVFPDKAVEAPLSPISSNPNELGGTLNLPLLQPGHYVLHTKALTTAEGNTPSGYDVYLRTDQESGLGAIILLPGIGMLIIGILAIVVSFRYHLPRSFLGIGMLLWFLAALVSVLMGFSILPEFFGKDPNASIQPIFWIANGVVFAISYTIFVLGMAWHPRFRDVSLPHVFAIALGFGSMEAIIYGIFNFVNYVVVLAMPSQFKPGALDLHHLSDISLNPLFGQSASYDEIVKIIIYTAMVVLVYYSHRTRNWSWYALALVYTGITEVLQMGVQNSFPGNTFGEVALVEGALTLWALVGVAIIYIFGKRYNNKDETEARAREAELHATTAPVGRTGLKKRPTVEQSPL